MNLKKIALVSIAAAAVAAAPAFAACPDPGPTFGQLAQAPAACAGQPADLCNVQSAGTGPVVGRFWGAGAGNFAVDNSTPNCAAATCGSDNGGWASDGAGSAFGWIIQADSGGGPIPGRYWIGGDWAGVGDLDIFNKIDGCTNGAGTRMYIGLSDSDAAGNGYFALAWAGYLAAAKADYDFTIVNKTAPPNDQGTGGGNIILRLAPRPGVVASSRLSSTSHSFTVSIPGPTAYANALYGDNTSNDTQAIQGVRIYQKIVPRGTPVANVGNARGTYTAATGVLPLGSPNQVLTVNCATNSDVYLTYGVVGDSGFEAAQVGTVRAGQCGPTLADPSDGHGKKPINRGNPKSDQ